MKYYQFSKSAGQNYGEFSKNYGSSNASYSHLGNKVLNKSNFVYDNTNRNYYSDTSIYTDNTNISYFKNRSKRNLYIHKEESLDLVPSKIDDADNYKIRRELQSKDFDQDSYESDTDNEENKQKYRNRYSDIKKKGKNTNFNENYTSETLATELTFNHISKMKKRDQFHNVCKSHKNKIPLMVLKNNDKQNTDDSDIVYIPIVFMPDIKSGQNNTSPINLCEEPRLLKTKKDNSEELLLYKEKYPSTQSWNSMKEQVQKQTQTTKSVVGLYVQNTVQEPEVVTVYEKSYADFNMQTENETSSKDTSLKSEKPSLELKQTEPSTETIKNPLLLQSTPNVSTLIEFSSETNEFVKSESTVVFHVPKGNRPPIKQSFTMKNTKVVKSKSRHHKTSGEKITPCKPTNDVYGNSKVSNFTIEKMHSNCESVFSHICNKWKTKTYDIMNPSLNDKNNKEIKAYYFETVNLQPFKQKVYESNYNSFKSEINQGKPKILFETVPKNCGKLIQNVINNNKTSEPFKKGVESDLNKNLPFMKTKELKLKVSREKLITNKHITLKESIDCDNNENKDKNCIDQSNAVNLKPSIKVMKETDNVSTVIEKPKVTEDKSAATNFQRELQEITETILKGCHVILGKTVHNMVLNSIDIYTVFKEILFREIGIFKFKL